MSSADWIPFAEGVKVVAEHPCGLLAVEKPHGLLAHPNPEDEGARDNVLIPGNYSFEEEAFHVRDGQGGVRRVHLLNRLDSPTSGVLLLALDAALAAEVRRMFARSAVSKRYYALVRGRGLRQPHGTWQDVLVKSKGPGGGVRSSAAGGSGVPAVTLYHWERAALHGLPISLLRLEPRTGRTHQLRVQTSMHGHPILGDRTYGDFDFNKTMGTARGFRRLFLHAASTELSFDWAGKRVHFSAATPMPEEFSHALGGAEDGPGRGAPKDAVVPVSPRLRVRL
ncbi:MAG: RluA family pseudouridine synthase [Verrucomicrobia bacterium]|nr:RluA family pseudouridine synthase [Verrucomicrobiota bacterium]